MMEPEGPQVKSGQVNLPFTTYYLLLTTYYSLLTTYYLLLTIYYSLLTTSYILGAEFKIWSPPLCRSNAMSLHAAVGSEPPCPL